MPKHFPTTPVTDDDAAIAAALEDVSVVALIASVVQFTGDPSFVRGAQRPLEFMPNEFQGRMTDADQAELRRLGLDAIRTWRDSGCPPAAPLSVDSIREVMDWIACEHIPDDYAAMFQEEMDLAGEDPRAIHLAGPVADPDFSVLVIGCGISGLLAGIRMREAGIPFEIIEKNDEPGGTWWENHYPGCRVDVASHFYSYSFALNPEFSEYYARQPELFDYLRVLFDDHHIGEHVRWNHEVERAEWDDTTARWHVTCRGVDGEVHTTTANVVISGVGILNRPLIPDLPNLDEFDGPVFHSSRWDHSVDLHGKRVALIGAGASGFQIGPAIVDDVEQLVVFQRTPQWMAPNPRYHAPVAEGERWAMRHLPGYAAWYRFLLMWGSSDKNLELVRMDSDWPDFPHSANAASAARRDFFAKWIERGVGADAELLAKVMPDYPPMTKRMLQDDGSWLRCLTHPNTDFVRDAIVDIGASFVATAGARYDVDVIVLATGFRASEVLWPMEIVGRGGVSIAEMWDGKPSAYRGISVAGFPNFFMLAGPGTGLAHGGSVIFAIECEMRYIADALRLLLDEGHRSVEPTATAHERYRDDLTAETATLMWGHPHIEHSWYKAADGNVYVLCPWRNVDTWKMTAAVDPADHVIR